MLKKCFVLWAKCQGKTQLSDRTVPCVVVCLALLFRSPLQLCLDCLSLCDSSCCFFVAVPSCSITMMMFFAEPDTAWLSAWRCM